jgi:hypothetical protein
MFGNMAAIAGALHAPFKQWHGHLTILSGQTQKPAPTRSIASRNSAGMIVSVAAFPLLAIGLRTRALPAALAFSPRWRLGAVRTLEIAAALVIAAIGGWQMTGWAV